MEEKKYPIGGYAPGNYHCNCCICGSFFHGDKRAVQCEPCAVAEKALFDALSPDEQAAIIANNVAAARAMFSKWDKPSLPPLPEPILTDEDVKDWGDTEARGFIDRGCIWQARALAAEKELQELKASSAVWVKASERLPVNGGVDNKVIVRGILNEQGYANHRFVAYGFRNFSPVEQEMYFEYGSKSFLTNDVEWLDESGTTAPEWDSIRLIGRVKERFKELEEKQHDWRSFYCAWLEGRVDMLQQIKGYGRLYELTAAGREEDWISVYDQLPEEGGRYWCYVQQLTDLGYSYFQWNCDYNPQLRRFSDMTLKGGHEITHWRPQPEPPKFKQKEK